MISIGEEMEQKYEALTAHSSPAGSSEAAASSHAQPQIEEKRNKDDIEGHHKPARILDICMAPGGYSAVALRFNPYAEIHGITLPRSSGGYSIQFSGKIAQLIYQDINYYLPDFPDGRKVPATHIDASLFIDFPKFGCTGAESDPRPAHQADSPRIAQSNDAFNLIFCDGNVLRTHVRADHRADKNREAGRLTYSQLILAMTNIAHGGTVIILLHHIDNWFNVRLLQEFSTFSTISLFKSTAHHQMTSAFYLITKNIQAGNLKEEILNKWKENWWSLTFGGEDGLGTALAAPNDNEIDEVLKESGEKIRTMAEPAWKTQKVGLERRMQYLQQKEIRARVPESSSSSSSSSRATRKTSRGRNETLRAPSYATQLLPRWDKPNWRDQVVNSGATDISATTMTTTTTTTTTATQQYPIAGSEYSSPVTTHHYPISQRAHEAPSWRHDPTPSPCPSSSSKPGKSQSQSQSPPTHRSRSTSKRQPEEERGIITAARTTIPSPGLGSASTLPPPPGMPAPPAPPATRAAGAASIDSLPAASAAEEYSEPSSMAASPRRGMSWFGPQSPLAHCTRGRRGGGDS